MKRIVLLLLMFVSFLPVCGQVMATGAYAYGNFHSFGFDSINVGNLNTRFTIPIVNLPGRGLPFTYALQYEGLVWTPGSAADGSSGWIPDQSWGFSGSINGSPIAGYLSYTASTWSCMDTDGQSPIKVWMPWYRNFVYHDPQGVNHTFSYAIKYQCNDGQPDLVTGSGASQDGSGYTLIDTSHIQTAKGIVIAPPVESASGASTITDTNGNQIAFDGNGNFIDTRGTTALTISGAGTAASPKVYTYNLVGSGNSTVTVNYKTYQIATNFGCPNTPDFGTGTPMYADLIDNIQYTDTDLTGQPSKYVFTYEPTPGSSGTITGRLASVTLRAGGLIQYQYTSGNNGIECADGTTSGITRTDANGQWQFTRSVGTHSHTVVTDALGNASDYDFMAATVQTDATQPLGLYYEVNRNNYNGAAGGGHVLSRQTCYNNGPATCIDTPIQLPVQAVDTYNILNDSIMDGTRTFIDPTTQLVTEIDTHDFGQTGNVYGSDNRGADIKIEIFRYGQCGGTGLLTSDVVYDGQSNVISQTTFCYDQTPVTTTSVPQHVSPSGQRGNLTTKTVYASNSDTHTTTFSYYDTGSVLSSTSSIDGTASATTQYSYDSTNTFVTGTVLPTPSSGVSMSAGAVYDPATGVQTSSTDVNHQQTQITNFDSLLRPGQLNYPDGGRVTLYYQPTEFSQYVYQNVQANTYSQLETQLDGYGRVSRTALLNDTGTWYQQDTCYDGNGNVAFQSYRYTGQGWSTPKICSGAGDSYTYEVLGRVSSVSHGDGSNSGISYVYQMNATRKTDENQVAKITQVDALGRPTAVCELTSPTMYGQSPGSCGTNIAGTGFVTTYQYGYSTSGNIGPQLVITQGSQIRTFVSDWLGRPIYASEPERGSTSYSYGANAVGATASRVRARANQTGSATTTTTSQYDLLNRLLSLNYDDNLTPTRTYIYDQTHPFGDPNSPTSLGASNGRLTRELVSAGNGTGEIFGYDPMGRISVVGECRPSTCGSSADVMNYTYDQAGNMLTSSDGNGVVSSYQYTRANELKSLTSSLNGGQNLSNLLSVQAQNQSPFGPLNMQFGNGLSAVNSYDAMGRMNGRWVCANSTSPGCSSGSLVDGSTVSWQGNRATGGMDAYLNSGSTYGYDDLNRLTSAVVNGTATTYSYDRYGNRVSQTPGPNVVPLAGNNQLSGFSYDAAGNLMQDAAGNQYVYDAEGNVLSINNGAIQFTYDAFNQRVRVDQGGSNYEYDFDASGRRVSIWQGNNHIQGQYYANGVGVGFYTSAGTFLQHKDWLGTERIRTTYNGSVAGRFSQGAFGDNPQASGSDTDDAHFAGQDLDRSTGTSHAQFRELDIVHGRWMSPDPYTGSYHWGSPQSLNRYSYVASNPLRWTDRLGLKPNDNDDGDGGDDGDNIPTPGCEPNCTDQNGTPYGPNGNGGISGGSGGTVDVSSGTGDCFFCSIFSGTGSGLVSFNVDPSKPSVGTCLAQAASNGRGIALGADLVGDIATGFAIANPASTAAILIGAAATSVGTINAIAYWSNSGGAIAGANQTVAATGVLTHGLEIGSFIRAGTSLAKGLTHAGVFGSVVSTVTDASAAISAYTSCRSGKP